MRTGNRLILVVVLLFFLIQNGGGAKASPPDPAPGMQSLLQGGDLILDWTFPAAEIREQEDRTTLVSMGNLRTEELPGAPRLPFTAVLLAIPSAELPGYEILQSESKMLSLAAPLALSPAAGEMIYDSQGFPLGQKRIPADDPAAYQPELIRLEYLGETRGVHLARLAIHPALPAGARLVVYSRLRLKIPLGAPPEKTQKLTDPLLTTLAEAVINPQYVVKPVSTPASSGISRQAAIQRSNIPRAVIEIEQPGMYQVNYAQLISAAPGLAGVNPANLRLARAGTEIAYEFVDQGSANIFDAGDAILFYAQPFLHRYSKQDAYHLWYDAGKIGLRIQSSDAPPGSSSAVYSAEIIFDQNKIYTPEMNQKNVTAPGRDGDYWAWDHLRYFGSGDYATYPFQMPAFNTSQPADLDLWVLGYSAANHALRIGVNGCAFERSWQQYSLIKITLSGIQGCLASGSNSLRLEILPPPGASADGVVFDSFAVRYTPLSPNLSPDLVITGAAAAGSYSYTVALGSAQDRFYRITNPAAPVRLTRPAGASLTFGDTGSSQKYLITAASLLRSPKAVRAPYELRTNSISQADYLIITPPGFHNFANPAASPLAPLINLRQSQGLTVAVEDLNAIYDHYRAGTLAFDGEEWALWGGFNEAEAVRNYLLQVKTTWTKVPAYVLLVGDGTSDPKGYRADSKPTFFPPYLALVNDPLINAPMDTASDHFYVTFTSPEEKHIPDYLVGRLPVNSGGELQTVVNKIVQYETGADTQPAWWHNLVGLVADRDYYDYFRLEIEMATASLNNSPLVPMSHYYQYADSPSYQQSFRQAVMQMWNRGAALIFYAGHGAYHFWSDRNILHTSDVPLMTNGYRLPVVVEMTCYTGSYHNRTLDALDETLLRAPNGGAVAVWGSTGSGISYGHVKLADGFLQKLLEPNQQRLGEATLAGRLMLLTPPPANSDLVDLVATFHLFGDPATIFNEQRIQPLKFYLPQIR